MDNSDTAAPEPLLVWKHHRGGGVAAKASTLLVAAEASPRMDCEAPPREPRPILYDYNIHLNEHKNEITAKCHVLDLNAQAHLMPC